MKVYGIVIKYNDDTKDNPHHDVLACDCNYKTALKAAKKITEGLKYCYDIALAEINVVGITIPDKEKSDEETV